MDFITRVDPLLVDGNNCLTLFEAFQGYARSNGISISECEKLLSKIPQEVAVRFAFKDKLSQNWLYDFGDPIGDPRIIGTHTFPRVSHLVNALKEADERLTLKDNQRWLGNLWNKSKNPSNHMSMLEEISPLYHLVNNFGVFPNIKSGAGDVDWELIGSNIPSIYLEVKYRHGDLHRMLKKIMENPNSSPQSPRDADILFASLEHKFDICNPSARLQGVWIATHVKHEKARIQTAFNRFDPKALHFALIVSPGAKDKTAFLLIQPGLPGQSILDIFGFEHNPEKVFS
jgi:hypothetical protein